jgi:hypothetical protein
MIIVPTHKHHRSPFKHSKTIYVFTSKKNQNPIKDWWLEPSHGRQKGKAKKRPKDKQLIGTKKKGES